MSQIRTAIDIGHLIRERRKQLGWDQARLAAEIGVSRQWIVDIEKGKSRAELQLVLRALQALELNVEITLPEAAASTAPTPSVPSRVDIVSIVERHRTASIAGTNPPAVLGTPDHSKQFSQLQQLALPKQPAALEALKTAGQLSQWVRELQRLASPGEPDAAGTASKPLHQKPSGQAAIGGDTAQTQQKRKRPAKAAARPSARSNSSTSVVPAKTTRHPPKGRRHT